jgi:hypothetical protein
MSQTIDDITIADFVDDGSIKELDKHVLSRGAWTTIMFRYQELDPKTQDFGDIKYSIRRYQKRNDKYWLKSKFNISSSDQAKKIIDVLTQWLDA